MSTCTNRMRRAALGIAAGTLVAIVTPSLGKADEPKKDDTKSLVDQMPVSIRPSFQKLMDLFPLNLNAGKYWQVAQHFPDRAASLNPPPLLVKDSYKYGLPFFEQRTAIQKEILTISLADRRQQGQRA